MRTEADAGRFAEHPLSKGGKRALQVAHRDAFVHNQPLQLMEQRRVRCVQRIGTVNATGGDDANRRFGVLHRADLDRRGLRTEQNVVGDIKGVLRVTRRMVFRNVQRLEVVVIQFHLGSFDNREAHSDEDVLQLPLHLGQRMDVSVRNRGGRHGDVQFFCLQAMFQRFCLRIPGALCNGFFDGRANLVCQLPDLRAFFGRERTHAAQHGGQLSLFAKIADLDLLQIGIDSFNLCQRRFFDFCELFFPLD